MDEKKEPAQEGLDKLQVPSNLLLVPCEPFWIREEAATEARVVAKLVKKVTLLAVQGLLIALILEEAIAGRADSRVVF